MKKNIAIDLDGTVTSPYYWLNFFNKTFNGGLTEKDCTEYDLTKLYNIDRCSWDNINTQYIKEYLDCVDVREDAKEVLNDIKQYFNCYFITARQNTEYIKSRTMDYLKENNFDDIPLYMMSSHYKVEKAKELGVEIFIEDSPKNAIELANSGITVFLINTNYNQNVEHENIIRVDNWYEIGSMLFKKLSENKIHN